MRGDSAGPVHVGLNLLFLLPGVVGGTETYATSLVRALARLDAQSRYTLFLNRESAGLEWPRQDNVRTVVCEVSATSRAMRYAFEQAVLPGIVRREGIDLLHSLGYVAPLRVRCPSVVTVHDLNYEAIPEAFTRMRREILRRLVPAGARRAAAVLTLSEASRRQIIERIGVPPERVVVTHCAAGHLPDPSADPRRRAETLRRLGIREPYILALSSGSPHKNLPRLLRAFAALTGRTGAGAELVLAGHEPTRGESLRTLAAELGVGERVRFTGYLSDADLAEVRAAATLFAFPSLYEGFGIPVLEAMEAGVPVVSSHAASLPEVVGDAGILVDPTSVEAIAAALGEGLESPTRREALVRAGRAQAARFSWMDTARRTLEVYRAVHAGGDRAPQPAATIAGAGR